MANEKPRRASAQLKDSDIAARSILPMGSDAAELLPSVTSLEMMVVHATALSDIAWDCYREFKRMKGKEKWSAMRHYTRAVQFAEKLFRTIDKLSQGSGTVPPKVSIRIPENSIYRRDENGDLTVIAGDG